MLDNLVKGIFYSVIILSQDIEGATINTPKKKETPYNLILGIARNLLETRVIIKILTHPC